MIQTAQELDTWYQQDDPWDYESSLEDIKRRDILLSELPKQAYNAVLDIGCGTGFITHKLPGKEVIGTDFSAEAIKQANQKVAQFATSASELSYVEADLYDLKKVFPKKKFDLIIITGVLYPQYIGKSNNLTYLILDQLLADNGVICSVHIDSWYSSRLPYLLERTYVYNYREFAHRLEIYRKQKNNFAQK